MPVDPDLVALMLDTVQWLPRSTMNSYGEPTFGASVPVTCRVEPNVAMIRDMEGQEKAATATFWTDHVYGIKPEDKVILPSGATHPILRVETWEDDEGPSHEVVHL